MSTGDLRRMALLRGLTLVCVMQVCGGDRYSLLSLATGEPVQGPASYAEIAAFLMQEAA